MIHLSKKIKTPGLLWAMILPLLILFTGLGITYELWHLAVTDAQHNLQQDFDNQSNTIKDKIMQRFKVYSQLLHSTRGLFYASKTVERAEFRSFVSALELQKFYPGVQGIGFSLVFPAAEKQKHITRIQSEGFPNYSIRPEGNREIYTSIIYLEPFEGRNLRAFGYDMYSETVRRQAMDKARDSD
jgi:CHASE1-domain containing sensor protein